MEAIELLKNYQKRLEPFLKDYFAKKTKQAGKIDFLAEQAVKTIADFTLSGGKRIRPTLVYYGYLASGGKDDEKIIEASMAIELLHSFLLIHDDIIDRDARRHGVATVHERYKKIGQKIAPKKDNNHFGNSMALIVGDIASSMANEIMFNAKFSPQTIIQALDKLQKIVYVTIPGEMLDVVMENRGYATEEEILRMFEGKTSRYTFEGPLHLGNILAGGSQDMRDDFSQYALPLGKAFQIRDDILGVFGDEKKIGKPVGSDIIEGKQTILLIKALENGNKEQRKMLKYCLGNKELTKKEIVEFRNIIEITGSLEYCKNLAKKLVAKALSAIQETKFQNQEARKFLEGIANYVIERTV